MSLRLLYGVRGPQASDPIYQCIYVASWVLTILPLTVFIVATTRWLCWFLLLIAAFSGLELILARRAMQRRSAWGLLTGIVGSLQPTQTSLKNHQGRFTGIVGRAFRRLVHSLEDGNDMSTAIAANRPALPIDAQAYAAIDVLTPAPAMSVASLPNWQRENPTTDSLQNAAGQQLYQRVTYLSSVLLVMFAIVVFLAIKIIPSFEAIFADFELDLPKVTVYLISFFSFFSNSATSAIIVLGFIALVCLALFVAVMYLSDVAVLRPITDRLFFNKHRALILRLFAVAVERGQSLTEVAKQLTEGKPRYPSRYARGRLRKMLRSLSAGSNWKDALRHGTFVTASEYPMLETAQRAGNLPWVLRMQADQKIRKMLFRWSAIEQVVFPLVVLFIGLIVLFICVGLFLPLVELINGLV